MSVALTANNTKARMTWSAKEKLDPPGEDHVRIAFQLKHAKLYSFWIE